MPVSGMVVQGFTDPAGGHIFQTLSARTLGYFAGVPTASIAGWAPGGIGIDVTNGNWYRNTGSASSATWTRQTGTITAETITTLTSTTINYTTLNDGTTSLGASALELNRAAQLSSREVAISGATTITLAAHSDRTCVITSGTGAAITLPAMTGSGGKYRFVFGITASSGSWTIVATAAHLFGSITQNTDTANGTSGFTTASIANASGITTMTFDGTTKGGRKGDWIEIEDVATSIGIVRGATNASGTEATPFS